MTERPTDSTSTPLCRILEADINITVQPKLYTNVPDLLADLTTNGFDLTPLQPFLNT